MTVLIEQRETIDDILDIFTEYLASSFKLTDEKKIEQLISDLIEKINEKKRIIFIAFHNNKAIGFLAGNIERKIVETTGFYIQDGFDSENCGYKLISTFTNKLFEGLSVTLN